jgi:hypothetical protein
VHDVAKSERVIFVETAGEHVAVPRYDARTPHFPTFISQFFLDVKLPVVNSVTAVFLRGEHFNVLIVIELSRLEYDSVNGEFFPYVGNFLFVLFRMLEQQALQFYEWQIRVVSLFCFLQIL